MPMAFLVWLATSVAGGSLAQVPADSVLDLDAQRAVEVARQLAFVGPVQPNDGPLGVIDIPRVGVHGEILEGVDDVTIRRAVGHFPQSARPFQPGNLALAAHRTTHFRGLRDIRIGDTVLLRVESKTLEYVVERTWVVDPHETWVIDPTTETALTLVTCYPFDYRGHAPKRFIVRARATGSGV
ncbi:MAG TPA: class D sortase [Candidatus Polarisedimenticolaceae bacterium]|nr:class D sortase [Candidatus Polarisedimenticolaceae bacterium]